MNLKFFIFLIFITQQSFATEQNNKKQADKWKIFLEYGTNLFLPLEIDNSIPEITIGEIKEEYLKKKELHPFGTNGISLTWKLKSDFLIEVNEKKSGSTSTGHLGQISSGIIIDKKTFMDRHNLLDGELSNEITITKDISNFIILIVTHELGLCPSSFCSIM